MTRISVVIYGVNEAQNFESVVLEAQERLKKVADSYQFILIDDGSTDHTPEVLATLKTRLPNAKIIIHPQRRGIGACLKDGFKAADLDLVTFMPADGQINPQDLESFADAIRDVDFVTTYYDSVSFPLLRRVMSRTMRLIVFILFGPSPRIEGSYMFRRRILDAVTLNADSFAVNFEFVIKASRKGFKFKELPTLSRERISGKSKVVNFNTIKKVFLEILKLRINFS